MKNKDRYDTSGLIEGQFEPGSRKRVLKNLRGIARKREMDLVEAEEYYRTLEDVAGEYDAEHRFTANDICKIHSAWLGDVYQWAGNFRRVNLSKDGFPFAMAAQIQTLMDNFEQGPLKDHTPCKPGSIESIAESLSVVHAVLVLIHPFRDGNGRVARLLAILMGLQAGFPALDFSGIIGKKKKEYFHAIRISLDRDYEPMTKVFISVLKKTMKNAGLP